MNIDIVKKEINEIRNIAQKISCLSCSDKSDILNELKKKNYKPCYVGFSRFTVKKSSLYGLSWNDKKRVWTVEKNIIAKVFERINSKDFCFVELSDIEKINPETEINVPFNYGLDTEKVRISDERVTTEIESF